MSETLALFSSLLSLCLERGHRRIGLFWSIICPFVLSELTVVCTVNSIAPLSFHIHLPSQR